MLTEEYSNTQISKRKKVQSAAKEQIRDCLGLQVYGGGID